MVATERMELISQVEDVLDERADANDDDAEEEGDVDISSRTSSSRKQQHSYHFQDNQGNDFLMKPPSSSDVPKKDGDDHLTAMPPVKVVQQEQNAEKNTPLSSPAVPDADPPQNHNQVSVSDDPSLKFSAHSTPSPPTAKSPVSEEISPMQLLLRKDRENQTSLPVPRRQSSLFGSSSLFEDSTIWNSHLFDVSMDHSSAFWNSNSQMFQHHHSHAPLNGGSLQQHRFNFSSSLRLGITIAIPPGTIPV